MENFAVIIAARNEELVIGSTLKQLKKQIKPKDIYLISDGSSDKTDSIARENKVNLFHNKVNIGKSKSLKKIIKHYRILKRYKYVFLLDADTIPQKNFFKQVSKSLKDSSVACVCGQVVPENRFNMLVAYRRVMYFVWQFIYKKIGSKLNAVIIAPGTASVYKSSVIKKIDFDQSIIIEDFDFTFQVHRKRLGRIVYNHNAIVVTQDPDNILDYFKQLARWSQGFFQTCIKHKVPFKKQRFEYFAAFIIIQEFIHMLSIIAFIILILYLWLYALYPSFAGYYVDVYLLIYIIAFDVILISTVSVIAIIHARAYKQLLFIPFMWFIQFINFAAVILGLYSTIFSPGKGKWISPKRH